MPMMDILKGKVTLQDWAFVGVVLAVTAVLFVSFYFLAYTQQQHAIEEQREYLDQVSRELAAAREIDDNIADLREEAEEMDYLVNVFEERLPEEREIPSLLSRFERQAGELGLRVQLASLPTRTADNMEVIPYRVTARGRFHDIVTFINMLERDERYFKVSDIDIGEERDRVSEAVFVLSTFRFVQRDTGSNNE